MALYQVPRPPPMECPIMMAFSQPRWSNTRLQTHFMRRKEGDVELCHLRNTNPSDILYCIPAGYLLERPWPG